MWPDETVRERNAVVTSQPENPQPATVQFLNPDTLSKNPAYSQAVAVSGPVKTIYIGAQTAMDASGNIVGEGDIAVQTEQVLRNVQACLEAAGAGLDHLIGWSIYIVQGQPLEPAVAAFQRWWGNPPNAPFNNALFVSGFPRPEFLLGIAAIAVVPDPR